MGSIGPSINSLLSPHPPSRIPLLAAILVALAASCTTPASLSASPSLPTKPPATDAVAQPLPTLTHSRAPSVTPTPRFMFLPTVTSVARLSDLETRHLVMLRESPDCVLPCWNGLTPGKSNTSDIAAFFARLGVDAATLAVYEPRNSGESEPSRFVGSGPPPGGVAFQLGLDSVAVGWDPSDGKPLEIWLDYVSAPPGFDARSLLSGLGTPETVLMSLVGGEVGPVYQVVFTFPAEGLGVRMEAFPPDPSRLCLTNEELNAAGNGPLVILLEAGADPLPLIEEATSQTVPLEDPRPYTGLSQEEFVHALTAGDGCAALHP
jgi:hypothetical protein